MFSIKKEEITNVHLFFRRLESVYFIFISVPLGVFLYTYFKNTSSQSENLGESGTLLTDIVAYTSVALVAVAFFFFKKEVKKIQDKHIELKHRLVVYFTLNVKLYFVLELIAFLWAVLFWQTHVVTFAMLYGIHIAIISLNRNTPRRMSKHLKLNKETYDKIRMGKEL